MPVVVVVEAEVEVQGGGRMGGRGERREEGTDEGRFLANSTLYYTLSLELRSAHSRLDLKLDFKLSWFVLKSDAELAELNLCQQPLLRR